MSQNNYALMSDYEFDYADPFAAVEVAKRKSLENGGREYFIGQRILSVKAEIPAQFDATVKTV